jgi:hypothetical protein
MSEPARNSVEDVIPPAIGNLARQSPQSILSALGRATFCGEIRFTLGEKTLVIELLAGHPQLAQDGTTTLDRFLAASAGAYELREQIPLPSKGSRSTPLRVYGSLSDQSTSELLRFCESIGLTGKLELRSQDDLCVARYNRGELVTLAIDGRDDKAIDVVFGWHEGKWSISQKSIFDDDAPSAVIDVRSELGTIELALSALLARGVKSPGEAPVPSIIAGHHSNADTSVKVIFRAPKLEHSPSTQHSATNVGKEVVSLEPSSRAPTMTDEQAEQIIARSRATTEPSRTSDVHPIAQQREQTPAETKAPTTTPVVADARGRAVMVLLFVAFVFALTTIVIALTSMMR